MSTVFSLVQLTEQCPFDGYAIFGDERNCHFRPMAFFKGETDCDARSTKIRGKAKYIVVSQLALHHFLRPLIYVKFNGEASRRFDLDQPSERR